MLPTTLPTSLTRSPSSWHAGLVLKLTLKPHSTTSVKASSRRNILLAVCCCFSFAVRVFQARSPAAVICTFIPTDVNVLGCRTGGTFPPGRPYCTHVLFALRQLSLAAML